MKKSLGFAGKFLNFSFFTKIKENSFEEGKEENTHDDFLSADENEGKEATNDKIDIINPDDFFFVKEQEVDLTKIKDTFSYRKVKVIENKKEDSLSSSETFVDAIEKEENFFEFEKDENSNKEQKEVEKIDEKEKLKEEKGEGKKKEEKGEGKKKEEKEEKGEGKKKEEKEEKGEEKKKEEKEEKEEKGEEKKKEEEKGEENFSDDTISVTSTVVDDDIVEIKENNNETSEKINFFHSVKGDNEKSTELLKILKSDGVNIEEEESLKFNTSERKRKHFLKLLNLKSLTEAQKESKKQKLDICEIGAEGKREINDLWKTEKENEKNENVEEDCYNDNYVFFFSPSSPISPSPCSSANSSISSLSVLNSKNVINSRVERLEKEKEDIKNEKEKRNKKPEIKVTRSIVEESSSESRLKRKEIRKEIRKEKEKRKEKEIGLMENNDTKKKSTNESNKSKKKLGKKKENNDINVSDDEKEKKEEEEEKEFKSTLSLSESESSSSVLSYSISCNSSYNSSPYYAPFSDYCSSEERKKKSMRKNSRSSTKQASQRKKRKVIKSKKVTIQKEKAEKKTTNNYNEKVNDNNFNHTNNNDDVYTENKNYVTLNSDKYTYNKNKEEPICMLENVYLRNPYFQLQKKIYIFYEKNFVFGRSLSNVDVFLHATENIELIEERHASLSSRIVEFDNNFYVYELKIKDNRSKNGVYINGKKVKQKILNNRDLIQIGKFDKTEEDMNVNLFEFVFCIHFFPPYENFDYLSTLFFSYSVISNKEKECVKHDDDKMILDENRKDVGKKNLRVIIFILDCENNEQEKKDFDKLQNESVEENRSCMNPMKSMNENSKAVDKSSMNNNVSNSECNEKMNVINSCSEVGIKEDLESFADNFSKNEQLNTSFNNVDLDEGTELNFKEEAKESSQKHLLLGDLNTSCLLLKTRNICDLSNECYHRSVCYSSSSSSNSRNSNNNKAKEYDIEDKFKKEYSNKEFKMNNSFFARKSDFPNYTRCFNSNNIIDNNKNNVFNCTNSICKTPNIIKNKNVSFSKAVHSSSPYKLLHYNNVITSMRNKTFIMDCTHFSKSKDIPLTTSSLKTQTPSRNSVFSAFPSLHNPSSLLHNFTVSSFSQNSDSSSKKKKHDTATKQNSDIEEIQPKEKEKQEENCNASSSLSRYTLLKESFNIYKSNAKQLRNKNKQYEALTDEKQESQNTSKKQKCTSSQKETLYINKPRTDAKEENKSENHKKQSTKNKIENQSSFLGEICILADASLVDVRRKIDEKFGKILNRKFVKRKKQKSKEDMTKTNEEETDKKEEVHLVSEYFNEGKDSERESEKNKEEAEKSEYEVQAQRKIENCFIEGSDEDYDKKENVSAETEDCKYLFNLNKSKSLNKSEEAKIWVFELPFFDIDEQFYFKNSLQSNLLYRLLYIQFVSK